MSVVVRELKSVRPPLNWEPFERNETTAFVARKHTRNGIPLPALQSVVFEAQQILGRCIDPSAPHSPNASTASSSPGRDGKVES